LDLVTFGPGDYRSNFRTTTHRKEYGLEIISEPISKQKWAFVPGKVQAYFPAAKGIEERREGKRREILVTMEWVSSFQKLNLANFKKRR